MNLNLSTLVAALVIARASGELYMVYQDQPTVMLSSDSTVIAAENVGEAILEVTQKGKPEFGLLHLDKLTPDEVSRIHPNLLPHLGTQQLLELVAKSRQKTRTDEKIAPRIRRLRDWLADALAGKAPSTLGKENMEMVQKLVSDPTKMHPMTALLREEARFSPRQLRKLFEVQKVRFAEQDKDLRSFDKLINSVIDAYLSANDPKELYQFLSTLGLPEPLASNARIAEYIKEYEEYFADDGDLGEEADDGEEDGQRAEKWSFADLGTSRKDASKERSYRKPGFWSETEDVEGGQSDEESEHGNKGASLLESDGDEKPSSRRTITRTGEINLEEPYKESTKVERKRKAPKKPVGKEDDVLTTTGDELDADAQATAEQPSGSGKVDSSESDDSDSDSSSESASSSSIQVPAEVTLKDPPSSTVKSFRDLIGNIFRRKPRKPAVTSPSVSKVPLDQNVEITYEGESKPPTSTTRKPVLSRWPHQTRKAPQTRGGRGTRAGKEDGTVVEQWSFAKVGKGKGAPQSSSQSDNDDEYVDDERNEDEDEDDSGDEDKFETGGSGEWDEAPLSFHGKQDKVSGKPVSKGKKSSIQSPKVLESEGSEEDEAISGVLTQQSDRSEASGVSGNGSDDEEDDESEEGEDDEDQGDEDDEEDDEENKESGLESKGGEQSGESTEALPEQWEDEIEGEGEEKDSEDDEPSTSDGEYERVARQASKKLKEFERGRKRRQTAIEELGRRRDTLRDELALTEEELQARQTSLEKFMSEAQDSMYEEQPHDGDLEEDKAVASERSDDSFIRRREGSMSERWTEAGEDDYSSPYKPKHRKNKRSRKGKGSHALF